MNQMNTYENDSTVVMPSLFPEFVVNFNEIRVVRVTNRASKSNDVENPYVFVLIGNELYWLTEKSIEIIAVLTDVTFKLPNDRTRLTLGEIQVNNFH